LQLGKRRHLNSYRLSEGLRSCGTRYERPDAPPRRYVVSSNGLMVFMVVMRGNQPINFVSTHPVPAIDRAPGRTRHSATPTTKDERSDRYQTRYQSSDRKLYNSSKNSNKYRTFLRGAYLHFRGH
jgi:hypothetical protein